MYSGFLNIRRFSPICCFRWHASILSSTFRFVHVSGEQNSNDHINRDKKFFDYRQIDFDQVIITVGLPTIKTKRNWFNVFANIRDDIWKLSNCITRIFLWNVPNDDETCHWTSTWKYLQK